MEQRKIIAQERELWNAIASHSYMAPHWLAKDIEREQLLAAAAQARLLANESESAGHAATGPGKQLAHRWRCLMERICAWFRQAVQTPTLRIPSSPDHGAK